MSGSQSTRKTWSKEDTLLFISCYAARKDVFLHKKNAFANVLEDMIYKGFKDVNVTTRALDAKMRTLLSAYKCGKDNNRASGAAPCTVPYMQELDEIFGDRPIMNNWHSTSFGVIQNKSTGKTINSASTATSTATSPDSATTTSTSAASPIAVTPTSLELTVSAPSTFLDTAIFNSSENISQASTVSAPPNSSPNFEKKPIVRRRKTGKEKFYEAKLKLLAESNLQKLNFMKEMKQLAEKQLNAEDRKIKLLEELVKQ